MDFEIAILNGYCEDGERITNSLKAAYLYADRVRAYDFFVPRNIGDENKAKKESLSDFYEAGNNFLKVRPLTLFEPDNLDERMIDYFTNKFDYDLPLSPKCPISFRDRIVVDCVRQLVFFLNNLKTRRDSCDSQYILEKHQKELHRMGIDFVNPPLIYEGEAPDIPKSIGYHFIDYCNDEGFKLLNGSYDGEIVSPSKQATTLLSEHAISKLPGFANATLDEMIDIREELDGYIVPYREAIVEMVQTIKEIPDTESLQQECAVLYLDKIEPKVAEINAAVRDNNVFKNIFRSAITSELGWTGIGSLAVAIAAKGDITKTIASTAIAVGGYSVTKGLKATREKEKALQNNELYFLYEAGNILENEYS